MSGSEGTDNIMCFQAASSGEFCSPEPRYSRTDVWRIALISAQRVFFFIGQVKRFPRQQFS